MGLDKLPKTLELLSLVEKKFGAKSAEAQALEFFFLPTCVCGRSGEDWYVFCTGCGNPNQMFDAAAYVQYEGCTPQKTQEDFCAKGGHNVFLVEMKANKDLSAFHCFHCGTYIPRPEERGDEKIS